MYISYLQIRRSLKDLSGVHPFFGITFLACKKARLPVGTTVEFNISAANNEVLDNAYNPLPDSGQYFHPFKTSKSSAGSDTWVSNRYGSTSLQRIATGTFATAFIHTRGTSKWGWNQNYIDTLAERQKSTRSSKIPLFELACWLYRNDDLEQDVSPEEICERFIKDYNVDGTEIDQLFADLKHQDVDGWLADAKVETHELHNLIGFPSNVSRKNLTLSSLSMKYVGPSTALGIQPTERLNLLTGDNSLGKTFILQCIWWWMTGEWIDHAALPHDSARRFDPQMSACFQTDLGTNESYYADFLWSEERWERIKEPDWGPISNLSIYCHHDGSFAIWDPAFEKTAPNGRYDDAAYITLNRAEVWNGRKSDRGLEQRQICNGILADWIEWENYDKELFNVFREAIKVLSPSQWEDLQPAKSVKLPGDSRRIPALNMPYGNTPIIHASAGVQKILSLVYVALWCWQRHQKQSNFSRQITAGSIVIIVDEVESHLHPRWQRLVVPALTKMIEGISGGAQVQSIIATHSPLVLASAEPIFDEDRDSLHHIELIDDAPVAQQVPFVRYGTADAWLTSSIFGLDEPRSHTAEKWIREAVRLQEESSRNKQKIREVHRGLVSSLSDSDSFWRRWLYFASENGKINVES
jgi:predicted ATP-binding protein involved in virulence